MTYTRIEDSPWEIDRAAKILAALDAGESGLFGITRRLYPYWTMDEAEMVCGTLARLVAAGKVTVRGIVYTRT